MENTISLSDVRNYLYDETERRWWWSFFLALATQFMVLVAVIIDIPVFLIGAGLISLTIPIGRGWLQKFARDYQNKADKCRRLILYSDGLGHEIRREDLATVQSWVMGAQVDEAPFTRPYYASNLEAGPQRLVDIAAESAYFTSCLSGKVASYLMSAFVISVLIVAGILYFATTTSTQASFLATVGKSAAVVIAFLCSADILLLWQRYSELQAVSHTTFHLCARLSTDPTLPLHKAMQIVEDYHLKLIQSPPIPKRLYFKYQHDLNAAYSKSCSLEV